MARINLTQMLGISALFEGEEVVGDYSADVNPPSRSLASKVTTEQAIALPAAFRAIDTIAGMGWMLSLEAVRGATVLDPAPALILSPDVWRSVESFLERTLVNLATAGEAFWLKTFDSRNNVTNLEVLDPHRVWIKWKNGVKAYSAWTKHSGRKTYSSFEIEHLWYLEVPGHDHGLGPIQACRAAFAGIIDIREYADGWFGDHASDVPSGVLTSDQYLEPEEAREYKKAWLNPTDETGKSIVNGPSVRVLGKGLTYSPIMLKPEDAQWLESQGFGVLEIARMFGMPADYLLAAMEGSSLTYTTTLMVDTRFMRNTMLPRYLRKIEAALSNCLPRGQKARFRVGDFLKPDVKTQADVDAIYLKHRVISAQEIRDRDGIPGNAPDPAPAKPSKPEEAPE